MQGDRSSLQENGKSATDGNLFSIIVVGGSAGSFNALIALLESLTEELKAAILIVLHLSPNSNVSFLVEHLQQHSAFLCKIASESETIKSQTIYFSVPQAHLLVSDKKIILGKGSDENRFKPSIDVLFRSAAVHFRECVIVVILSGFLDDGAAGMKAIQQCGGVCIVLGTQSLFTCPDCGGSLWHIDEDGVSRCRCFTGHALSENYLMEKQNESVLLTLWTALRIFKERKKLLQKCPPL